MLVYYCYDEGGMECYSLDEAAEKLLDKKDIYPRDKNNHFFIWPSSA